MERFLSLTDAEREAELKRGMAEYQAWLDSLPRERLYAHKRRNALESCLRWRRICGALEFFEGNRRKAQMRLVDIRYWYRTGIWPGEA